MEKHRQEALTLLATETSPVKRRALIEELARTFRVPPAGGHRELHQVGEALAKLLPSLPAPERALFSEHVAAASDAPTYLVRQLAMDEPEIAAPVLARSPVLVESDLAECLGKGGTPRLAAIARRPALSKTVQAAILDSGDGKAIAALFANRDIVLSGTALNAAFVRARKDETIAESVVGRADLSVGLLAELFFAHGTNLRLKLLRALAERREPAAPTAPQDDAEARFLQAVRAGDRLLMLAALRRGFHIAPALAERILRDESCEALAVVAVGSGLSRAAYSSFVVLSHEADGMNGALALFDRIPATGAQRLLAHWQAEELRQPADATSKVAPAPAPPPPEGFEEPEHRPLFFRAPRKR